MEGENEAVVEQPTEVAAAVEEQSAEQEIDMNTTYDELIEGLDLGDESEPEETDEGDEEGETPAEEQEPPEDQADPAAPKTDEEKEALEKWHAATRRDKESRQLQQQLREQQQQLAPLLNVLQNRKPGAEGDIALMEALGIDYSAVTQHYIGEKNPSPEAIQQKALTKTQELEQKLARFEQQQFEQQQKQVFGQYEGKLNKALESEEHAHVHDAYELLGMKPADEIQAFFTAYQKEEGRNLTPGEMAVIMSEGAKKVLDSKKDLISKLYKKYCSTEEKPKASQSKGANSTPSVATAGAPQTVGGQEPMVRSQEDVMSEIRAEHPDFNWDSDYQ